MNGFIVGFLFALMICVIWATMYDPDTDNSDSPGYKNSTRHSKKAVKTPLFSESDLSQDENILEHAEYGQAVENNNMIERQAQLTDLKSYDDYNSVVQFMSLDPDVYDSHNKYTVDMGNSTTGASMLSTTDHPNDINPWILRKPNYHDAFVQPGARQEPSEYPDQMREKTYYVIG